MTDIAKILENAPKWIKLYSPAYCIVELEEVKNTPYCGGTLMATEIKVKSLYSRKSVTFDHHGRLSSNGECMLFPGRDGADWDSWQRCLMPQSEGSYVVDCYGGVFRVGENGLSIKDSSGNVFGMSPEDYCKGGNGFRYATKDEVEIFENNKKKNIRSILKCDDCNKREKGVCIRQCDEKHIPWRYYPIPEKKDIENENDTECGCAMSSDSHSCVQTEGGLKDSITTKTPKFEEGDWIVRDDMELDNQILHIDFVSDDGTKYSFEGDYGFYGSKHIDWNYHKWTIWDAKPGDILRCRNFIFIYKGTNHTDKGDCVMSFCDCSTREEVLYSDEYTLCTKECEYMCDTYECCPATEQERNILFGALRRNDYIWDSEKLCLKSVVNVRMTDGGSYGERRYVQENLKGQFELSQFEAIESAEKWRDSLDAKKISVMSVLDAYAEGMQAGYRKAFIDRMNNVKLNEK